MINFVREALFKQDSVYKTIDIRYWNSSTIATNVDMYNDEFSVEDILCDGEELTFGEACARKVTFATTVVEDLVGADIGVIEKLGGYNDIFSYGRFTVADERYIESKGKNKVKEVTAYDPVYTIYNTDVTDWYNGLWASASTYTLTQFRTSFFDYFGISQTGVALVNDSMTVKRTVSGKINGATVLKSILATNGCMGRCVDGHFEYFYLPQIAPDLSNAYEIAENGYYMSENHSKFTTQAIDKLIIRDDSNEQIITVGSGDNAYVMANNMLLYGKTAVELQTIAQNIYNKISVVTYVPFEIEVKGNPCLQVGDPIYFTTVDGEVVKSYILRRNYTGIQSQKDTYSADGLEKRAEVTVSVNDELIKLRNKTNRLGRDLEHTTSVLEDEVLDPTNPLSLKSEIDQTASDITLKVDKINGQSGDSFSYEMTSTKAEFKNNGNTVLKLDSTGAFIGNGSNGFQIGTTNIHNGMTSLSDTTHNGIYLGTDGIALGKGNFKVTDAGALTAKTGYIGNGSNGFTIGNTAIYNGMTSLSDTSHDGIYVGTDGIALGKGAFKVSNDGTGNIGDWKFSQGFLVIYNGSTQVASIVGTTTDGGKLSFTSSRQVFSSSIFDFEAGSPQGSQSEGIFSFTTVGGSHRFVVDTSNIELNGNVYLNNRGKITCASTGNQNLQIFSSNEGDYGVKLGVYESPLAWAFCPVKDEKLRLGSPNFKWTTIYAQNGTINTSDRRQKKCIKPLQEKAKDFIMDLKPVSYKFKDGDRTHYGLIAQDVEDTMKKLGLTEMDFAGLCKDKNGDDYIYGLRYDEFIPLCIKMLQMQEKKIERLEGRIK